MEATKKKTSKDQKPANTLSSIVSDLIRAAIGGNHQDVPDNDLDKYVADMIMKSANKAEKQYQTVGLDAYTTAGRSADDKARMDSGVIVDRAQSNGLKTNKRFLSAIIKSTDDHNQALIRAEEKKATELAKELIADLDKRATEREAAVNFGRGSKQDGRSSASRMRMDDVAPSSSQVRSISPTKWKNLSTHHSKPPLSSSSAPRNDEVKMRGRGSMKYDVSASARSSSPSFTPQTGSKMDKYFQEGYDPLLDTHSDDGAKSAPKHKEKKGKKDRRSKDDRKPKKRRHKTHGHKSSRSKRHRDSDSEDSTDTKGKRSGWSDHRGSSTRRGHDDDGFSDDGNGKFRRPHHDEDLSDDKRASGSRRSRSKRGRSASRTPSKSPSRIPSPSRSKRYLSSRKSTRLDEEDKRARDKPSPRHKRRRDSISSSSDSVCIVTEESENEGASKKRRSRPRSRSTSPTPKPAPREWDLHKINKDAIRAHLFKANRTKT